MILSKLNKTLLRLVPKFILRRLLHRLKRFRFLTETLQTQTPISFDMFYNQKVRGHFEHVYWPVHGSSTVINYKNICCGIETSPGYSPGNYIQALGKIYIGDYTQIAPNVGIITGNHDLTDNRKHVIKEVHIGKYCWLGMGAIILPGVILGNHTVVAAGSVVTKSFEEGYCVIGGNPAKILKNLDPQTCPAHKSTHQYNGYISNMAFDEFRKKNLNV